MQVFSANLIERVDRKMHVINEYSFRNEFENILIPSIKDGYGAIGLWKTLEFILKEKEDNEKNFFIFCEDDHIFTDRYSKSFLNLCIEKAKALPT